MFQGSLLESFIDVQKLVIASGTLIVRLQTVTGLPEFVAVLGTLVRHQLPESGSVNEVSEYISVGTSSDSDQGTERSLKLSTAPTATLKPTRTGRKSLFRPSCTSQPPPKKKPPNPKPRKTAQQTQQKKDTHHTPTKKHHTQ